MTDEHTLEQEQKPRLHVALRIFLYLIATLFGIGIFQALAYLLSGIKVTDFSDVTPTPYNKMLIEILSLVPLFIVTFLFRKYLDRKSFVSLGFSAKGRGPDLLLGLLVAVTMYVIGSVALMLSGNIQFSALGIGIQTFSLNVVTFITVAIMEELMVRGYILNNLLTKTNKYIALIISSVIFSAMHGMNPGIMWLAMLNLFLAGVLLGSAYIFTRNLWFAMSLHFFWNLIEGPVLGYRVSGNVTESFFSATPVGNTLLSGGDFGFEGSVVCTVLSAALALAIIFYYERKRKQSSADTELKN